MKATIASLPQLFEDFMPGFMFVSSSLIVLKPTREDSWPRCYKTFFILNSAEHEIILLINVKLPAIVGNLTFISMINTTSERQSKTLLYLFLF